MKKLDYVTKETFNKRLETILNKKEGDGQENVKILDYIHVRFETIKKN